MNAKRQSTNRTITQCSISAILTKDTNLRTRNVAMSAGTIIIVGVSTSLALRMHVAKIVSRVKGAFLHGRTLSRNAHSPLSRLKIRLPPLSPLSRSQVSLYNIVAPPPRWQRQQRERQYLADMYGQKNRKWCVCNLYRHMMHALDHDGDRPKIDSFDVQFLVIQQKSSAFHASNDMVGIPLILAQYRQRLGHRRRHDARLSSADRRHTRKRFLSTNGQK